jgi:hypothetical protein
MHKKRCDTPHDAGAVCAGKVGTKSGYLARLRTLTHVEIKALAVAGLVLFDQINARRLIANNDANNPRAHVQRTNEIIEAGCLLQEAINDAASDLPAVLLAFTDLASREENS